MNTTYSWREAAAYRPPRAGHIAVAGPVSMGGEPANDVAARLDTLAAFIREHNICEKNIVRAIASSRYTRLEVTKAFGILLGANGDDSMSGNTVVDGVEIEWHDMPF